MLLETLKKILAAVGVYLCMFGLLKAAIHTNYAIQKKDGRRMAVSMSAMALRRLNHCKGFQFCEIDVLTQTRIYKPRSEKPPSEAPEDSGQTTMF